MFAISLQYLKKEVRDVLYFLYANEHRFLQVGIIVLMEVARHVQSTQIRKLLILFSMKFP